MQLLFIIAMHSLIEGAQDNKDSHMALAVALRPERTLLFLFSKNIFA